MSEYKINVIIPVYNVEKYIDEFINSIYKQTFKNYSIIFVYDKSTDSTLEKIISIKNKLGNQAMIIMSGKMDGLGAARDIALDSGYCTADYVMFLDGDDRFEPDYFETMYRNAIKSDADIVTCGFDRFDSITGKIYSVEMNRWKKEQLTDLWQCDDCVFINPAVWNKIYKRDVISNIRFSNIKRAEDTFYYTRLLPNIKKITILNDVLCHYRVRRSSLSFSISEKNFDEFLENFVSVKEYYTLNGKKEYLAILEMIVFIHAGISFTYRLCENTKYKNRIIKKTKQYMDDEFPGWRTNRYLDFSYALKAHGFRGFGLWACRLLYKTNLFIIFVITYSNMIKLMKKDIKW